MPSSRTSARDAPLAPTPRSETPCEVGLAVRLPVRRERGKPGPGRRASSRVGDGEVASVVLSSTTTLAGVSASRVFVRVAVTVMVSAVCARKATMKSSTRAQGKAKTNSALPRVPPYASGANPFIHPPHPLGTATYCLPPADRVAVNAAAGVELPQHAAGAGVVGVEHPVRLAGEDEVAAGRQQRRHHRMRAAPRPHLPQIGRA